MKSCIALTLAGFLFVGCSPKPAPAVESQAETKQDAQVSVDAKTQQQLGVEVQAGGGAISGFANHLHGAASDE